MFKLNNTARPLSIINIYKITNMATPIEVA